MADAVTSTHCPYCALQCGMRLSRVAGRMEVAPRFDFPVNPGGLCIKGWSASATLTHADRLRTPLVRDESGRLVSASWEAALDLMVRRFAAVQGRHGFDAVGVMGGGSLTNEKAYLLGKFARVAVGTSNIDYNGRFCMSSAAAAAGMAFGLDRGLPFPVDDIARASAILLVGCNAAETMPPLLQYFEAQRAAGGTLIVVDPRRTATADAATCHFALKPGTDVALANGLLHLLIRDNLIDQEYIDDRTEGFEDVRRIAEMYWPERVEELTGVPAAALTDAARLLGTTPHPMVLTSRGPEQQSRGVNNTLAYINIALALGAVGRPFSGYGCVTGQGNGQGGREHGQKADQLPGYRRIDDEAARSHVANVWGIPAGTLPGAGKSAFELLDTIGRARGIRAMFVMGSNLAVSAPHAARVHERLAALEFLAVADFFVSETAAMADVVLPSAQWAEEDGTMTTLEGRVVRRRRAVDPPADARSDIDILCALGQRMGYRAQFTYDSAEAVFDELRLATRGAPADYTGITYARIDAENGVFWPCPALTHPGTPRLFVDSFPTSSGRARFHAVSLRGSGEQPSREYPLYLTTGRVLAQYQSGTQTRRVRVLQEMASEPIAELHPITARTAGVADGGAITVTTRRGSATFRVRTTPAIREDTVFVPFHWPDEQSVNRLTSAALDDTSKMPAFKVCAARVARANRDDQQEVAS